MSGSTIGGVVGGVIGFVVSGYNPQGFQVGWMIGSAVGGYVDPDIIEGPKLTDPQRQTSAEGVPRPIVYGTAAVMGNIIQCQSVPTQHSHKARTGKGGPVQKTYTYTRTCAIRICEAAPLGGEMKLRRAWVNGKLAYDVTGSGAIDADSAKFLEQMTFYSGSETQMPDADLEALPAEDGGGVGNVPAYRGTCYVVLPDVDVTQGGGALPQFRWEVSSDAEEASSCTDIYGDAIFYYPLDDASRNGVARELIQGANGTYSDTEGVTAGPALRAGGLGSFEMKALEDYMVADHQLSVDGIDLGFTRRPEWTISCYYAITDTDTHGTVLLNLAAYYQSPSDGWIDWQMRLTTALHAQAAFTKGNTVTRAITDPSAGGAGFMMATRNAAGEFKLYVNGIMVDSYTGTDQPGREGRYLTVGGGFFPGSFGFIGYVSDVAGWDREFSPAEVQAAYLYIQTHYGLPDLAGALVSEHGLIVNVCTNVVTPNTIALSDVVADLIERAGVTDYDVSALAGDTVRGYAITQPTDAAGAIRALMQVYYFDLPEWGNSGETYTKLRAVKRGGASVLTLLDDDLVDADDDEDTRAQQVEFPRKVNFFYPNPDLSYEVSKQTAERVSENVKATSEANISTAVIFSADEAAQRADVAIRLAWEEAAGKAVVTVPEAFTGYVPSDIITRNAKRYRIDRADWGDGQGRWELTRDRAKAYESNATAGQTITPPSPTSNTRGPTVLAAMNLPSLRSADNVPGIYLAVCGLLPGWAGADIYVSYDGGVSETLEMTILDEATLGALDADCDSGATDLITARIFHQHELDSATDAQIAANANRFAIISEGVAEIGQVKTAAETATVGTYDLSDLTRGELGTTAASHTAEDRFVLLDSAVKFLPIDAAFAGETLILRAVSRGTVPANNATTSLVFDPPTFIIDGGGA